MFMNYIDEMKEQNIKFELMDGDHAMEVMKNSFSYYDLISYACLFDKYRAEVRRGQFVNLDFIQLYYLACIDNKLENLLMEVCKSIEKAWKTRLIYDMDIIGNPEKIYREYFETDCIYLMYNYNKNTNDLMESNSWDLQNMTWKDFINSIQFGTLEKFIHFFYKMYAKEIYGTEYAPEEMKIAYVRKTRNIVAHGNSLINKLLLKTEKKDVAMLAFLGNHGIKSRTLSTNMSRKIINDIVGTMLTYREIVKDKDLKTEYGNFITYCEEKKDYFLQNDILVSSYRFINKIFKLCF